MKSDLIRFIDKIRDPAFAIIPNNWEEYFKTCASVDARGAYKKNKTAFEVSKVDVVTDEISQGIVDVWKSPTTRQKRDINFNYEAVNGKKINIKDRWAIKDYGDYNFDNVSLELFICRDCDSSKITSYVELINCNGVSIVHSTLCHEEYLKRNMARYIFLCVIQQKIPTLKYFVYNGYDRSNSLYHFKEDLGIINHNGINVLRKEIYE